MLLIVTLARSELRVSVNGMRTLNVLIYLLILVVIAGCAAPGTPVIRHNGLDGEGPVVAGCQNIQLERPAFALPDEFITTAYLTTWSSALKEGAEEGYSDAYDHNRQKNQGDNYQLITLIDSVADKPSTHKEMVDRETSSWPEKVNPLTNEQEPFCRIFSANYSNIFALVENIFEDLDYQVTISNGTLGFIETDYTERHHASARWRDKYKIIVVEISQNQSVLLVYRSVFVSRSDDVFNEGISVGHNEAWIIREVDRGLNVDG